MNLFPNDPNPPVESKRRTIYPPFAATGPDGETCGSCDHCIPKDYNDRRYYKCEIRGNSNGSGTDIRKKWRACLHWIAYNPKC